MRAWLLAAWSLVLLLPATAPRDAAAQTIAGCLLSGPEEYWPDMWLDAAAARLYIADRTNARILIHDTRSLARIGEVSLVSYLPDRPQRLAGHAGAGTLYVIVCRGTCDSLSQVVAIDTGTLAHRALVGLASRRAILVDEQGRRLLAAGYDPASPYHETVSIVDVDTGVIFTSIDLNAVLGNPGHVAMAATLNRTTGDVLFFQGGCSPTSAFAIVNARTLAGEKVTAANACGPWIVPEAATWNPKENKLYITTQTWEGYFIYDRDTGESTVTSCRNDGSELYFSAATNRVYSGAEVSATTTVIDGASDSCQNVGTLSGTAIGFLESRRRAYFIGSAVTILDEDPVAVGPSFASCIPPPAVHRLFGDSGVAVDQREGRVFARIWEGDDDNLAPGHPQTGPELDYACILVIDDGWPKRPLRRHVGQPRQ